MSLLIVISIIGQYYYTLLVKECEKEKMRDFNHPHLHILQSRILLVTREDRKKDASSLDKYDQRQKFRTDSD